MLEDASPYHQYDSNELQMHFHRQPTVGNTLDEDWGGVYWTTSFYATDFKEMFQFDPRQFSTVMYMRQIRVYGKITEESRTSLLDFIFYLREHGIQYEMMPPNKEDGGFFAITIKLHETNHGKLRKSPQDFLKKHKDLFTDIFLHASPVYGNQIDTTISRYRIYPENDIEKDFYYDEERTILLSQYLLGNLPNTHGRRKLDNI